MKNTFAILFFSIVGANAVAQNVEPAMVRTDKPSSADHCTYADKAYTKGSVLPVGNLQLVCLEDVDYGPITAGKDRPKTYSWVNSSLARAKDALGADLTRKSAK